MDATLPLIRALQDYQQTVDTLLTKIAALEAKIAALEAAQDATAKEPDAT